MARVADYTKPTEPWSVGESETRLPIKSGPRTIAYVQMGPHDADHAALIAAAPDMLTALKSAERVLCGWECAEDSPDERAALKLVRDAISKAEGGADV